LIALNTIGVCALKQCGWLYVPAVHNPLRGIPLNFRRSTQ
jgi:hypothetical protein